MIDATNLSIIKLFNILLINNNVLFSTNIIIMIILIMINANDTAITILSIIFKNKSIKLKIIRVYKD